jgi:hypothetical protein
VNRLVASAVLALALVACGQKGEGEAAGAQRSSARPKQLSVITGLPLFFAEGFTLEGSRHPALQLLEQQFTVTPIDGPEQLPPGGLLLAAQPRAMTPERLVTLDKWVRTGGRLVLLADPWLTWPSDLPLGDPERAPVQFADTGLLAHWGLSLQAERSPALETVERQLGRDSVSVSAPGRLTSRSKACTVQPDGFVARCRLDGGVVVVVADADIIGSPNEEAQAALVQELHALSTR